MNYIVWQCPRCGTVQISMLTGNLRDRKLKCRHCGSVRKIYHKNSIFPQVKYTLATSEDEAWSKYMLLKGIKEIDGGVIDYEKKG